MGTAVSSAWDVASPSYFDVFGCILVYGHCVLRIILRCIAHIQQCGTAVIRLSTFAGIVRASKLSKKKNSPETPRRAQGRRAQEQRTTWRANARSEIGSSGVSFQKEKQIEKRTTPQRTLTTGYAASDSSASSSSCLFRALGLPRLCIRTGTFVSACALFSNVCLCPPFQTFSAKSCCPPHPNELVLLPLLPGEGGAVTAAPASCCVPSSAHNLRKSEVLLFGAKRSSNPSKPPRSSPKPAPKSTSIALKTCEGFCSITRVSSGVERGVRYGHGGASVILRAIGWGWESLDSTRSHARLVFLASGYNSVSFFGELPMAMATALLHCDWLINFLVTAACQEIVV